MAKPKIFIQLLVDRTGSMASNWPETVSAINAYVANIAGGGDLDARIGLTFFDRSPPHPVLQKKPEVAGYADWKPLRADDAEIMPRGMTPLLDAVGLTVNELLNRPAAEGERVQLVIMTDGQENASSEYKLADVRKLLGQIEAKGWPVIFLGANLGAFQEGERLGTLAGTTAQYAAQSIAATMDVAAAATRRYAASGDRQQAIFSAEERERMKRG